MAENGNLKLFHAESVCRCSGINAEERRTSQGLYCIINEWIRLFVRVWMRYRTSTASFICSCIPTHLLETVCCCTSTTLPLSTTSALCAFFDFPHPTDTSSRLRWHSLCMHLCLSHYLLHEFHTEPTNCPQGICMAVHKSMCGITLCFLCHIQ